MKVLVTGGAGFIGYHTSKALLERGDKVIIVDNFNDYYNVNLKKDRIKNLEKDFDFTLENVNISDYEKLKEVFEKHDFDKVCHLAAQAGVRHSIENPFCFVRDNVLGTLNLLELCKDYHIQDFVYASSSSVYGERDEVPFSEEDKVDKPVSMYASTKKTNEEIAHVYHHLYGINCTGLRFFTCYGSWGRPDMAYFLFVENILKEKPIKVFNEGKMRRDFTHVQDTVFSILSSLDKSFPFEIFNIGLGKSINLLDFISEIENCLGKKAEKEMLPMQKGDVTETFADISKAKKMLNYNPQVSLSQGIKEFVDWYTSYNNYE